MMIHPRIIVLYYLPVFLWGGLIFFFSSQSALPGPNTVFWDFVFKKTAHMTVYAVLYWLLFRAINVHRKGKTKFYWIPFIICFLYSLSDEIHQSLTPGRTPTLRDVGFDTLGMMIASLKLQNFL